MDRVTLPTCLDPQMQHRKGKRAKHTTTEIKSALAQSVSNTSNEIMDVDEDTPLASFAPVAGTIPGPVLARPHACGLAGGGGGCPWNHPGRRAFPAPAVHSELPKATLGTSFSRRDWAAMPHVRARHCPPAGSAPGNWFTERAKYIPMRLTMKERKRLRLLEAVLSSSDYTSKIDVAGKKRGRHVQDQLQEICAVMTALIVAQNFSVSC